MNGSEPIYLDVAALIGRKPVVPRVWRGRLPLLIQVVSPTQQVSGTHLEIREQGASVVVTDLKSTNGTIVCMPGRTSLQLHQGESLIILSGTVVEIGDGNVIEILPVEYLRGG